MRILFEVALVGAFLTAIFFVLRELFRKKDKNEGVFKTNSVWRGPTALVEEKEEEEKK